MPLFPKIPVKIPNKSGFDMSFKNLYTGRCGTLYPILCEPLIPGDIVSLGHSIQVQMPPMATDFYGNVDVKIEAFYVPNRILWGGWQKLCLSQTNLSQTNLRLPTSVPVISLGSNYKLPGSLADMLGVKTSSANVLYNALPFLAYHKIYDDWYRISQVQKPVFDPDTSMYAPKLPYVSFETPNSSYDWSMVAGSSDSRLADSVYLHDLRQRNWPLDYFTSITPSPQAGQASSLSFNVTSDLTDGTGTGSFTIAALRAANSLQQFAERNNIAGTRYSDFIQAHYGVRPPDAVTDRAVYLGSQTVNVYSKDIFDSAGSSSSGNNPFTGVGTKYANCQAVGQDNLINSFEVREHGYLMVIMSLVPERIYSSGSRRYLHDLSLTEIPFPLLSSVGDQEVYCYELEDNSVPSSSVFGYSERYAHYKYKSDEVHGLLRDGSSLEAFCLQTSISDASAGISSSFLQIPDDYLSQVKGFTGSDQTLNSIDFWASSYFNFKKVSCLPAYSIPTLGDLQNVHTEMVDKGGSYL